jgi:hypothetical protein
MPNSAANSTVRRVVGHRSSRPRSRVGAPRVVRRSGGPRIPA